MPLAALIAEIDAARTGEAGLSTAVRLHILADLKARTDASGDTGDVGATDGSGDADIDAKTDGHAD